MFGSGNISSIRVIAYVSDGEHICCACVNEIEENELDALFRHDEVDNAYCGRCYEEIE